MRREESTEAFDSRMIAKFMLAFWVVVILLGIMDAML